MTCNVIATGSQGNAVVLDGTILLDCGVPFGASRRIAYVPCGKKHAVIMS